MELWCEPIRRHHFDDVESSEYIFLFDGSQCLKAPQCATGGMDDSDLFIQKVTSYPREIEWKNPREIQLEKPSEESPGIVLKTCHVPRVKETWTIIIEIKENCRLLNSHALIDCGSRVTRINGYDITKSNSAGVSKALKSCKNKKGIVTLRIYEPSVPPALDVHVESQRLLNPLLDHSNSSSVSSISEISKGEAIKLESLAKDRRKSGKSQIQLRTTKTSGSHSWYTRQSSNLSVGSDLTPVETPETHLTGGCTETTPLMAFSHVGGPSSLGSDAENVNVGKVALQNPCNIVWHSNTEKITLQKTGKDEKVGFYYKIKKTSADAELYFLVEKVDVGSPSHGKLHLGDWIRSVNGTPITDNKDLLKQEIKKSVHEVTLVIQRPEAILRPPSATPQEISNKKKKENCVPQAQVPRVSQSTTPAGKLAAKEPAYSDSRFSDIAYTALDDIKIDGMSVYNGPVHAEFSTEPAIIVSGGSEAPIESFLTGAQVIPTFPSRNTSSQVPTSLASLSNSHRRNYSESSVAVLSKCLSGDLFDGRILPTTSASDEETGDINSGPISDCVKHMARRELTRRPYVRINQISTSSLAHTEVTENLLRALGIDGNAVHASTHVFHVSQEGLKTVSRSHLKKTEVEDFIVSKYLAESLKCGNISLEEVKKTLLDTDNKLVSGTFKLVENLIKSPPPLNTDFVEVEVENFVYEDVLNFWPSVYFTANAVYVLVFDYSTFVTQPQEEIKRLQMCINLIHSSSSMIKIYLLCDNYPSGRSLDTTMKELSILETNLIVTNIDHLRCSNCNCNKQTVPPDSFSQIEQNKHSRQVYYLSDRTDDWQEFVENIRNHIGVGQPSGCCKFPMSAVLAMKLLKQEDSETMTTTTMTYFKQNIMQKILPELGEREVLTALHHSGKVCWHSQVAHRTVHSNAHNMFILLRPSAIKESVHCIASHMRNTSFSHRLTHQQILSDCLATLKYNDKEEVLMFLELYHILEAVKTSEPQAEYYLLIQLMESTPNLSTLTKRYVIGADKSHQMLFVDFHGLLPVNMCVSLLARLGDFFGGASQIKSVCTGCFEYQGMCLLVQLLPYQGKAIILINFDQSFPRLASEGVFQVITSALKKAIASNLLTYHVGRECPEHITGQELTSLLINAELGILAQKLHILDSLGEQVAIPWQSQAPPRKYLNDAASMPSNGVHIDVNTYLQDIPSAVEDTLCKDLNYRGGWKYLFEFAGLTEWNQKNEFERSANPTKSLLAYLKKYSTFTLKDIVKHLQTTKRKDVLRNLKDLGVSLNV